MSLYDITRTVSAQTAVWPGDARFQVQPVLTIAAGASVNLTTLTLSPHTGTHADAYFHFDPAGAHPAAMPLAAYIGRARVVTTARRAGALVPDDFAGTALAGCERLLVHSAVSDVEDGIWPGEFPYLSVELVEYLAGLGVVLIGLDSPSVDAFDSQHLPCHHAIQRCGLVHLESLTLRDVPDGLYELIALPLKLEGACGSPVRAVLRDLEETR